MRVRWNSLNVNIMRETEIKRKLEISQLKRQIEILSTFMPDHLLSMNCNQKTTDFVGVLLFADVSGFTPLCEKYYKTGKGGIYRLTATLNAYIGAIVEIIYYYGGDVLKFSGDAFLALWKVTPDMRLYEVIHEVIVCALFIQQNLGHFETEVNVLLKVKLAVSCGNMSFSVIGEDDYKYYIIVGQAIDDVKAAEHVSVSGDVIVAPCAWGHLSSESYDHTLGEGGNVKIWRCLYSPTQKTLRDEYNRKYEEVRALCDKHIAHRNELHAQKNVENTTALSKLTELFVENLPPRAATQKAVGTWALADMRPFIIRPVQDQVEEKQPLEYMTEMREVTIQFVNIIPTTKNIVQLINIVDRAYKIISRIIVKVHGIVNKVSLFDKDIMFLILFGLRGAKHELESQDALKSAYELRNILDKFEGIKSVSIGITNGTVYCGVVGHPLRREFTVIGGAVNKAARIMCAFTSKVTCDHETFHNSKLPSSTFKIQPAIKLKGIEKTGNIFEYDERYDEKFEYATRKRLIGRDQELELIHKYVCHPLDTHGLCFESKEKVGKSALLRQAYEECKAEGHTVVMVNATATGKPYGTLAAIYKELYDSVARRGDVKLKRDLWNFYELYDDNRRKSVTQVFSQACKEAPSKTGTVIVFIDDVGSMDTFSFDILDTTLKEKHFRLICAGTFDDEDTWKMKWKISTSDTITVVELKPLHRDMLVELVCQFLNVEGVTKKMLALISKTCENHPGYVETCLLRLINIGEIEIKYSKKDDSIWYNDNDKNVIAIAGFSTKYDTVQQNLTSAAITLDLFDSFSPYQQLIIKTASVLGDVFPRSILMVLLKYPNEYFFSNALKNLFDEDVLECGSRYVDNGGVSLRKVSCVCYISEEEEKLSRNEEERISGDERSKSSQMSIHTVDMEKLPRYAFCKLIHFKSRNIKSIAYELLPANQKIELHSRITEVLENQTNLCPECMQDNSASVPILRTFKHFLELCDGRIAKTTDESADSEYNCTTDIYKNIIREGIKNTTCGPDCEHAEVPVRRIWDPTRCFCLEIMTRVYSDLVHHSDKAGHLVKKVFFMYQLSSTLHSMHELVEAIPLLYEASELCSNITNPMIKKVLFAKIHILLAIIFNCLGDNAVAKNHVIISLRQFDVPMTAFNYSLPNRIFLRAYLTRKGIFTQRFSNPMRQVDYAICLYLVSNIYANEGHWKLAKLAAKRSFLAIRRINPNVELLLDVYTTALDLYDYCANNESCVKLERRYNRHIFLLYTKCGSKIEFYSVTKLVGILQCLKLMEGNLTAGMRLGYRIIELNTITQAYPIQLELAPMLGTILLLMKRIDEAVHVAHILYSIGKKYDSKGLLAYFAFCIEMIVETNFYLEEFDTIETRAREHFHSPTSGVPSTNFENKMIVYFYTYYQRDWLNAVAYLWKRLYNWENDEQHTFMYYWNFFKYTEANLITLSGQKGIERRAQAPKVYGLLAKCEIGAKQWRLLMPRYLHYQAYYYKIMYKKAQAKNALKTALKLAEEQGNVLEKTWITLHEAAWQGLRNSSFESQPSINWRLARNYSPEQWMHIMRALPIE